MQGKIIAYQGVEGAYSHLACRNAFPKSVAIACSSFEDAVKLVEEKTADFAMIPVENSTAGRVEEIYRLIPESSLFIIDEHFEPATTASSGSKGALWSPSVTSPPTRRHSPNAAATSSTSTLPP